MHTPVSDRVWVVIAYNSPELAQQRKQQFASGMNGLARQKARQHSAVQLHTHLGRTGEQFRMTKDVQVGRGVGGLPAAQLHVL